MAVLPRGLVVPPFPQLVALVVASVVAGAALYTLQPRVDRRLVVAVVPWVVVGAAAHALYQVVPTLFPDAVAPFAAAPAVYVATAAVAGGCWAALEAVETPTETPVGLGVVGTVAVGGLFAGAALGGALRDVRPFWSLAGVVVAVGLTGGAYVAVRAVTDTVAQIETVALLAIFAHALDGVTTAIGVDVLGSGERSPLPATIMRFAGDLPTASLLGSGWLFVVVKLVIAVGIVVAFADYFQEDREQGTLLFVAVVAFGLGPAINNVVLFALRAQTLVGA